MRNAASRQARRGRRALHQHFRFLVGAHHDAPETVCISTRKLRGQPNDFVILSERSESKDPSS